MNKKILSILYVLLALFIRNTLAAQSMQYENQLIEKLDIQVVSPAGTSAEAEAVKARIKTREGDVFSQVVFDNDLKTLAKDYDRIVPMLQSIEGKMVITLKVWPKPTIRAIYWKGNQKVDSKTLQKELGITSCSVFDRLNFNKAFHKLKAFYVKKGFFEAELEYDVAFDAATNEVDLTIEINEGRSGRVKEIVFQNFTPEEEEEILENMLTKTHNFFLSWITDEGTYNEEAMQQDKFVILNYIQNRGYADAKVDVEICESEQNNRIMIYIRLTRGPLYHFGNLTLEGNAIFCKEDILQELTPLTATGLAYSPEEIRLSIQNMMNYYGKRGYIDAIVNFEPSLQRCDDYVYDVHFTVEEGEQFRVGLVKVFGNCSTQTKVILHETLLVPGEVFNIDKLQKTEERLMNIGYFSHVNVYAVKSEGPCGLGGNYRDVHIEVEETGTGSFSAFGGFSNIESLFGGISISEKNFNYKGFSCVLRDGFRALRGGGEYASVTATIGTKSRSYVLSWTKPYFMDTQWSVGFDLDRSSTRYVSKDYEFNTFGGMLFASYQVNPFLKTTWHYRLKNTVVDISSKAKHTDEDPDDSLRMQAKNSGLISAIGVSLSYDSTDNPQRPSTGFKSRLESEYAGVGGDHTFCGLAYLNSYYIPIDKKGVLKLRGDIKFVVPVGHTTEAKIPIDERLFLGGDDTPRGYRPYKLGPKFKPEDDPAGGTSLQFVSIEYKRRITKRLDAFVFCDSGHLDKKNFHFGRMNTSVGYGVCFKFLDSMPPLTLGMGYPIHPKSRGDVKKFFFTIGGKF